MFTACAICNFTLTLHNCNFISLLYIWLILFSPCNVYAVITFRVSRRRREMYCGHARLYVCLSAAACLHYCTDADVTWGSGRACSLVVHYWADLQSVHGLRCYGNTRNAWQSPAVIRQAQHTPHALRTHAPAIKSTRLLRARRYLQRGRSISSILRGVVTRTRHVSEYILVVALCLVVIDFTGM